MKMPSPGVQIYAWIVVFVAALAAASCGDAVDAGDELTPDGITRFQADHGIGPVTAPLKVGVAVDRTMADSGGRVFDQKCAACHRMNERYVGPALGDVLARRTPTFVMNMILNPQGMVEKHPVTKKLFAEYLMAMPNQNLTQDEARQVVEYLRAQKP